MQIVQPARAICLERTPLIGAVVVVHHHTGTTDSSSMTGLGVLQLCATLTSVLLNIAPFGDTIPEIKRTRTTGDRSPLLYVAIWANALLWCVQSWWGGTVCGVLLLFRRLTIIILALPDPPWHRIDYGIYVGRFHPISTTNLVGFLSGSYFLFVFHQHAPRKWIAPSMHRGIVRITG